MRCFLILVSFLACMTKAESITVEDFAKSIEYYDAVISPDGKHIAVQRAADEGKTLVAMLKTKDLSLVGHVGATTGVSPFDPIWVNDDRLVVRFTQEYSLYEKDYANGELLAINVNGKKSRKIIEHQRLVKLAVEKEHLNNLHGSAKVIHSLPSKSKSVLIHFERFKDPRFETESELIEINTGTGSYDRITKAASYDAYFVLSKEGDPLYTVGRSKKNKKENIHVVHKFENGKWIELNAVELDAYVFNVIAPTENPDEIIVEARFLHKTDRVYRYNVVTGEKSIIFAHANVDATSFDIDPYTQQLIAIHFDDGMPDIHLVDDDHLYARWYSAFYRVFPGKRIRITSATEDGKQLVVLVNGADEPGQFHLFDVATKKLRYLFNAARWIDAEQLAETRPFSLMSRDGLTLHGYLTTPANNHKLHPLVVLPHGGPYGVRDYWQYNSEVQFLASQGYAVLQVNFRASGGYGRGFSDAGYGKWGDDIQHDIIDATRWAAAREDIAVDRICIMGASFGGYSALMSPILEPELFQCAIGVLGVYDLNLMWTSGDIKVHRRGKNYLEDAIGSDREVLNHFSPVYRSKEIKIPVFLVHGRRDQRVSVKHYKRLKAALELNQHPHETLLFKKEGHGIDNDENRLEYFKRVKTFLDAHIGEEV